MVSGRAVVAAAGVLAVVVVVGLPTLGSQARWSDAVSLDGGSLRSGNLALRVGDATTQTSTYAFGALAAAALGPGQWAQAPLTVSNAGSSDLTYRLSGTAAGGPVGLGAALRLELQQVANDAACPTGLGAADPAAPATLLYSGSLLGATTDPARFLASAGREVLCVRVQLDATASPSVQSGSTTVTLTFSAVST